ncbi:MAG: hypothetical protein IE926_08520 [Micrococcales bacterium]|uniref:hypothetical protein n=1 Tax=Phycicoccus sp. TaxID=1902410 RepID=UPI0019AD512E|nr:hypothetical protein [Phycicoccus sp.]MBD3782981.1 hypothetical protein [Micrococcales bacterium]HMM94305.1 hypothetical protein [Phycicoccus sp.]
MGTVVSSDTRRRWLVVVAGTAVLVTLLGLVPVLRSTVAVGRTTASPDRIVARALASAGVAYRADGESRGGLALPDISGFGDLATLLGGTTRTRIWWDGPRHWRVDTVDATGESDTYGLPSSTTTWDYGSRRLVTVVGDARARLPRADDLVAPAAARRLLSSVGPQDRLSALPPQRLDGRTADGVRVVPGTGGSTIARADVWVDRATGLPLRVVVVGTTGGDALVSALSGVRVGRPDGRVLVPPAPPTARRSLETAPDLVARVAQESPWAMPPRLGGLDASGPLVGGTSTYGTGLVRVAVLPLPGRTARDVMRNATSAGSVLEEVEGGSRVRVGSSLLNALLVRGDDRRHAYVVAGLVEPRVLDAVAADLLASPPPPREAP